VGVSIREISPTEKIAARNLARAILSSRGLFPEKKIRTEPLNGGLKGSLEGIHLTTL
jgi:hypothetical protein